MYKLGGGRKLPQLLFVTHKNRLSEKIGLNECNQILSLITDAKMPLCMLSSESSDIIDCVRNVAEFLHKVQNEQEIKGVVLLGGHTVVPSGIRTVLDPDLLLQVYRLGVTEPDPNDNFVVWSDDCYGNLPNISKSPNSVFFELPELAVSRIPDGQSFDLMLAALTANYDPQLTFSIGLSSAEFLYPLEMLSLSMPNFSKHKFWFYENKPCSLPLPANLTGKNCHIVLHGQSDLGFYFMGTNRTFLDVSDVQKSQLKIIHASSCWGGIIVNDTAYIASIGRAMLNERTSADAISLQFLQRGAIAFVGCTADNLAPTDTEHWFCFSAPFDFFFWKNIAIGLSPAQAVLDAKRLYALGIPYIPNDLLACAKEMKILQSYTCLGLGW
jgi:hypothetical protein